MGWLDSFLQDAEEQETLWCFLVEEDIKIQSFIG